MGDRREQRPRAKGKRGGRVLRFAIGGSLLMAPLTAGCPEGREYVNEPPPEPTVNEPANPPAEETVNEPPEPDPEPPIKVNERMPPPDDDGAGGAEADGGEQGATEG